MAAASTGRARMLHRKFSVGSGRVQDSEFPAATFHHAGYHAAFRGMKSYNGVATLTRREPESVLHGLREGPDSEDVRIVQTTIDGIPIVNRRYFSERLDPKMPAIWLGDLNVAPEPIDVYHPDRRVNDPDFHIDAREAYRHAAGWGFTDVFRKLHPDLAQYTYWDYFRNAFERNWGWRIDHILATGPLAAVCRASGVDLKTRSAAAASDHAAVWAEFDL